MRMIRQTKRMARRRSATGPVARTPGATSTHCCGRRPRCSRRRASTRRCAPSRSGPASGVGTIYRHFPQRADLVAAVFRREVDACAEAASLLAAEHRPGAALDRWMQRYVDFIVAKRGLAAALYSGAAAFQALPAYFDTRLEPALRGLLDSAAAAGDIPADVVPGDLLRAVASLCSSSSDGDPAPARRLVALLVDGLRFPGGAELTPADAQVPMLIPPPAAPPPRSPARSATSARLRGRRWWRSARSSPARQCGSSRWWPKPRRVGSLTGGPPLSRQSRLKRRGSPSLTVHAIVTSPLSLERAPYFAALVESSCSATPMFCAASGRIVSSAPAGGCACRTGPRSG